ncbi:T9SS type A sorting domain-containing protein [Flavobacterium sp.]|uniref:DUF7619 domain-containing protein n=1 Tax=Flavobacterium sp. TaxID=239 RepID=UPI002489BCE0|nr:T9SS type A sorting domain-containing protein [Flavobacterium sp.]MDI1316592.1 T9SS type A sorting domain-containing protein [Flavobacterium sp.]
MNKLYTFLILAFTLVIGNAQIVTIPDANFKAKLLEADTNNYIVKNLLGAYFKIDANNNGQIEVSEALAVSHLDFYRIASDLNYVTNLTGLSSFTNLKFLRCSSHNITNLNYTGLIHLDELYCNSNLLTSINLNNYPSLKNFDCSYNQITSIVLTNSLNLELFSCGQNPLATFNFATMPNLKSLDCGYTPLGTLDVSGNNLLTYLGCSYMGLHSLNVSNLSNLEGLVCENNQLIQLDISGLTKLRNLQCANNLIEYLDLSDLAIAYPANQGPPFYELRFNNLQAMNVKNGRIDNFGMITQGNPNMQYVCCDESEIAFIQSYYPNCNINTYCSFTPGGVNYTIQGSEKLDLDANGCDNNDIILPNLRFTIENGTTSGSIISNASGNYNIDVSTGSYTITPVFENPSYYTASPTSLELAFPDQVSPVTQNFCITPNGTHQDVETWIVPIIGARPGFDSRYKIFYKNKGNTVISGSLNFGFEDNYMDFIMSTPVPNSQAFSLLTWTYVNLAPFETREIEVIINMNTPSETLPLTIGDLIKFESTIFPLTADETQTDNSHRLQQVVVGSFDPNDKNCLEGNVVGLETVGKYVHYMIRFENTGTAEAENIVVSDIIDTTKFDVSSLVPLSGSASFVTNIKNTNKVEFIFENINLPFDDANNDGYVVFKIKTKSTLVVGNTFSNSANIYFDYNFPILTNTYTTTITALGTQDFEFSSMFSLSPVPAKNILTITTKQDVLMSSVSIYNTLGQLVQVNTNPNTTLDVSELKSGSYFIKIVTDKGTASGKFIKE